MATEKYKGEWITTWIEADPCTIEAGTGKFYRQKKGWELKKTLVYCDKKYRLWVAKPGYIWDGPSYPSATSWLGKILKKLVGDREKYGLLASSAHHDQMTNPSLVILSGPRKIKNLRTAFRENRLDAYIDNRKYAQIDLPISEAAELYKEMLAQWPNDNETIGPFKRFKQYIGLLIFHPWYKLFVIGPGHSQWKKVESK